MGQQRRPAGRHVCDDPLHLEVGPHHGADVEQLVAVAWRQGHTAADWSQDSDLLLDPKTPQLCCFSQFNNNKDLKSLKMIHFRVS